MSGSIERSLSVDAVRDGIPDYFIERPWGLDELKQLIEAVQEKALRTRTERADT
jgi:FixJ family two-component response regulator